MTRTICAALPLLLVACALGRFQTESVPVAADETEALVFAERIQGFYGALENVPLDSLITFKNRELRAYFESDGAFSDYYASLASELREAAFANGRAERVEIDEFRFGDPGVAAVDVTLIGRHIRRLRFWERKLQRTDVWKQVEGIWLISPSKL